MIKVDGTGRLSFPHQIRTCILIWFYSCETISTELLKHLVYDAVSLCEMYELEPKRYFSNVQV